VHNDHSRASRVGRRRLLGLGGGAAAASLLPSFGGQAHAGASDESTTTSEAAPSTTAPPKRPTSGDAELLAFAQTVELAARNLYDVALADDGGIDLGEQVRPVVVAIREAHEAYAQAISAMLGRNAPNTADADVVAALTSEFSGSADEFFAAAASLESTAVATHEDILGRLDGTDGAELVASVLIVEARHATVMAALGGATDLDDLLFAEEADALSPAEG
jgi:Ferritin-like domain